MAHDLGRQAPVLGDKPTQLLDQAAAAPAVDGLEEFAEQLPLVVVEEFVAAGRRGVLEVKVLSVAEVDWCRRTGSAGGVLRRGERYTVRTSERDYALGRGHPVLGRGHSFACRCHSCSQRS